MSFDRSILEDIEANLRTLEIDEIKRRLQPLMVGYGLVTPIFDPGAFLYRARRVSNSFNKGAGITLKDLIYPPKPAVGLGRLNRPEQPVFYSSMHKESVFFEVQGLKPGDELVLSFWKTSEKMIVNNIGYTEYVFRQLGAKREVPRWEKPAGPNSNKETIVLPRFSPDMITQALSEDERREIHEAFSHYFMRSVGDSEKQQYKLTTAIGELHLGEIKDLGTRFAGVLYPSTRMWANGDNLALLQWFVDDHLEFRKALHVRIDALTDTGFSVSYLDSGREFDPNGRLIWLGRLPTWTLKPRQAAKFTATPGIDDDGDYLTSKDGGPCHWVAVDAETAEPILTPDQEFRHAKLPAAAVRWPQRGV